MAEWVLAGAAVAGAVGSGISAHASYQQGKAAEALAKYNSHQQMLNARMQLMGVEAQAAMQKRMAEAQFRLRSSEANARFANATTLENTAEAQSRSARESIRRKAQENEAVTEQARVNMAVNGFVESSGTQRAMLKRIAEVIQLERDDEQYGDELNRRSLFREASLERLGGKLALAGATLDRSSAVAEAGLRAATGMARYRAGVREAELTRLAGGAQRQSYTGQAWGSLFSGVASAGGLAGDAIRSIN